MNAVATRSPVSSDTPLDNEPGWQVRLGVRKSLDKVLDTVDFMPHQLDGIRLLANRGSFLLCDEMGLGKSLQALAVAAIDMQRDLAERVIVVAPATLKGNWADEIEKFTHMTYLLLEGTAKQREAMLDGLESGESRADVLIVNYEQLKPHLAQLNRLRFDIAIYDEAHYFKNHKSARTKAVHGLTARRHFVLTGSPMLNNVDELWALLHRIDPVEYDRYWSFLNRYAVFGGYKDKQIVGVKNKAELAERLDRVMLRRRKKDVLSLPDKQRIQILVDAHPEQAKYLKQAQDELKIDLPSNPNPMELENALTRFLRLKQILSTTGNIEGLPDHSYKLDRAVEIIEELVDNGEPVVVFTQFRGTLRCMTERLATRKPKPINFFQLHGDVPTADRQGVVRSWSEEAVAGRPAALLCMFQVAGVGLNMTAASHLIFLDKLFVPKLNEQAEDRVHRIGADESKPIQIFELMVRGSIEKRVEDILTRKNKLFGAVVETDPSWKKKLIEAALNDGSIEYDDE